MQRLLWLVGAGCVTGFLAAIALALLAGVLGWWRGMTWSFGVAAVLALIPYAVMRLHLEYAKDITSRDRDAWEGSLSWGLAGFLVAPFYLMRRDRHLVSRRGRR